MRVAICQMHSGPDVGDNLDEAEALVRAAADEGADLAALPEYLEFMGSATDRRAVAQPVPGSTADRLSAGEKLILHQKSVAARADAEA